MMLLDGLISSNLASYSGLLPFHILIFAQSQASINTPPELREDQEQIKGALPCGSAKKRKAWSKIGALIVAFVFSLSNFLFSSMLSARLMYCAVK